MAAHEISNKNQTPVETAYRFSEFELHPGERLLKRKDAPIQLTPKSFDALVCLVRKAGRLVTKDELMQALWPSTFVAEANLTNAIVTLRKAIGRETIRTVSKHGYRFELPVEGEPGVARDTYEVFSRAKELTAHRSLDGLMRARLLYWLCIAGDPTFAPAWAWLGRTCAILAKFSDKSGQDEMELAQAAFTRAFAIDPDLACAHQFYTPVQADLGEALQALERLRRRLSSHPAEPETFAGLVQALRYCGLLDESIEAHKKAQDLDPTIVTSVPHAYFLKADYQATVERYGGRAAFYLDAAAWAALGEMERTRALLRQRLPAAGCSEMMTIAMTSLLAIAEGRFEDAVTLMDSRGYLPEPEIFVYLARHYAYAGRASRAIAAINEAAASGFVCGSCTLRCDPWLESVRADPGFLALLSTAEELTARARRVWVG